MRPGTLALLVCGALCACAGARPESLGTSSGRLAPCPDSPNCVSSSATDASHRVSAFSLAEPSADAWRAAREAVAKLPRTQVIESSDAYLHAESRSALMGYVDDLELALDPSSDTIAVRSASRVGYGDWGVNRRRIETLRQELVAAGAVRAEP